VTGAILCDTLESYLQLWSVWIVSVSCRRSHYRATCS